MPPFYIYTHVKVKENIPGSSSGVLCPAHLCQLRYFLPHNFSRVKAPAQGAYQGSVSDSGFGNEGLHNVR